MWGGAGLVVCGTKPGNGSSLPVPAAFHVRRKGARNALNSGAPSRPPRALVLAGDFQSEVPADATNSRLRQLWMIR
jgi:hypothetical protein